MAQSIDDRLLKAYAMWGKNRVEFNRDGMRTLITFVWNEECNLQEKSAISMCRGQHLMTPAPSFVHGLRSKTCYQLCKGENIDDIVAELAKAAPLEFYLHDKTN